MYIWGYIQRCDRYCLMFERGIQWGGKSWGPAQEDHPSLFHSKYLQTFTINAFQNNSPSIFQANSQYFQYIFQCISQEDHPSFCRWQNPLFCLMLLNIFLCALVDYYSSGNPFSPHFLVFVSTEYVKKLGIFSIQRIRQHSCLAGEI